jgi:hypothetical protein
VFQSIMLYLPGTVIASGLVGRAIVSISKVVSARVTTK